MNERVSEARRKRGTTKLILDKFASTLIITHLEQRYEFFGAVFGVNVFSSQRVRSVFLRVLVQSFGIHLSSMSNLYRLVLIQKDTFLGSRYESDH